MKNFEVTGQITNGLGERTSIAIYNKKSQDLFFVGVEQAEELVSIIQKHLINCHKVYHCTTHKKLKRYESTGAILPPVRFWMTEYSAKKWMKRVGRNVLLVFDKPIRSFPLPIKGGAAWTDTLIEKWERL